MNLRSLRSRFRISDFLLLAIAVPLGWFGKGCVGPNLVQRKAVIQTHVSLLEV
jgi:hypothetical protein